MEIIELSDRSDIYGDSLATRRFNSLKKLLAELRNRIIEDEIIILINREIELLNSFKGHAGIVSSELKRVYKLILRMLEKKQKLVTKNYYRNQWMAIGMAVFGLPLGVILGKVVGNMGLIGAGIPVGMIIGMIVGEGMDKKAEKEGRILKAGDK
ncbi:MAG: hypothetical protein K9J25_01680 [Bacteroidales bacterium]|nr:hypothetical protein [Bacteroidales bacterium]